MPKVPGLTVTMVSISSIKLWKDNPRKNDGAVEALAESIKMHGFRSPLVVWRKNNTIYKGNTSYKAAKFLKLSEVPVIFADFKSEAAAIAYGIDDNKSGELAGWDYDLLKKLMSSSSVIGPVVTTSFTEKELGIIKNGIFTSKTMVKEIPPYNEEDDTFDICVTVRPKDKDRILQIVTKALEGTSYDAIAY